MHDAPFWQTPVLRSVRPVVEASRHVTTHPDAIRAVADRLAYEEFGLPDGMLHRLPRERHSDSEAMFANIHAMACRRPDGGGPVA